MNPSIHSLRVLTWHVHGNYLYYLTQTPCQWYLPVSTEPASTARREGYGGRSANFAWGDNVHEISAAAVAEQEFDVILFQSRKNFTEDQGEILSPAQRRLPRLYLEHDTPRQHPTDTVHPATADPTVGIVHVTHFNHLMWDNGHNPTYVVEHGVLTPETAQYTGELEKGIVVINNIKQRGRRLGLDVFLEAREALPLDLVGMGFAEVGGLASLSYTELMHTLPHYRFFFNPIRYTSLGLAVCEAMSIGLPIVGLATTEMAVTVENNITGFVHTDVSKVIDYAKRLLHDAALAKRLSAYARQYAQRRFGIERFANDWANLLQTVVGRRAQT